MGKYLPLENYLKKLNIDEISLSFQEIEKLIGKKLPNSAFKYIEWWSNDMTHIQAKAWLNAGWKTIDSSKIILNLKVKLLNFNIPFLKEV